jgi:putative lipoic acid-binding regulatory protein
LKNYQFHNVGGNNGNGHLIFPQVIDVKAIFVNQSSEQQSQAHLKALLSRLEIPNTNWRSRESAAGNYISFTIQVILKSEDLMKKLYSELKSLPGIKLAL